MTAPISIPDKCSPVRPCLRLAETAALVSPMTIVFGQATSAEPARVIQFSLRDVPGKVHTRADWKDRKAIVLFFLGTRIRHAPLTAAGSPRKRCVSASSKSWSIDELTCPSSSVQEAKRCGAVSANNRLRTVRDPACHELTSRHDCC